MFRSLMTIIRELYLYYIYVKTLGKIKIIIIIIIIIIIYCNWVVTRWQWLFYMYTKHEIHKSLYT